jgi:hypothetical protein
MTRIYHSVAFSFEVESHEALDDVLNALYAQLEDAEGVKSFHTYTNETEVEES